MSAMRQPRKGENATDVVSTRMTLQDVNIRETERIIEDIHKRATEIGPVMEEILRRADDYSHWGLNE